MNLYDRYLLPQVIHFCCGQKPIERQRAKVVPEASGRILEIGFGSGLNLPHYRRQQVERLWALEPSAEMRALSEPLLQDSGIPGEVLAAGAEAIPLDDNSADTVVLTYTLCTIGGPGQALAEIRRVLKPGGQLLFSEHGLARDKAVRRWQRRLNPAWRQLGGGCNLNRDIPALIQQAGFRCTHMAADYIPGFRPASFHYWGAAQSG